MDNRIIKLVTAGDGNAIAGMIEAACGKTPGLTLDRDLTSLPDEHATAVLVFLLTVESLFDAKVRAFARLAEPLGFPVLPVILERKTFDFRSLTGDLAYLGRLNAVAWEEGDLPGELVHTAIRRYLGLEPFRRDCRLFISYRRIEWRDDIDLNLRELDRHVSSRLAARRSFDRRLKQTLNKLKLLVPLEISEQGKRRLLLRIGQDAGTVRCLLDFENTSYDLMRLYRLSRGCTDLADQIDHGLLVHRGWRLSDEECQAVDWAKGAEPLHVLALDQVVSHLSQLAQPVI
jgi:hypothetical protein